MLLCSSVSGVESKFAIGNVIEIWDTLIFYERFILWIKQIYINFENLSKIEKKEIFRMPNSNFYFLIYSLKKFIIVKIVNFISETFTYKIWNFDM